MEIDNLVYLSLGTNLGNRIANLESALIEIKEQIGSIVSCSSVYMSKPIGFESDDDFLNICISCRTEKTVHELLHLIQLIEKKLGRTKDPSQRYSSRLIDIDIIFYYDLVIDTENLQVPHSEYTSRLFVLQPLLEIAPNLQDPRNNINLIDILNSKKLNQEIYKSNFVLNY